MSADPMATDPGAEREIDLRAWWDALLSRWWIVALLAARAVNIL